jgi:predicted nucleic acid-binding protein
MLAEWTFVDTNVLVYAATYASWRVHRPDVDDLLAAAQLEERHRLSFWDALVVVAAQRTGAATLLSEDLKDDYRFHGLVVLNPFRRDDALERFTPTRGEAPRGG